MFDVAKVREDFPILEKGIIYLDNAASSLTPEHVLQKMLEFYHDYRANVERGVHKLSQDASEEYAGAKSKVANLIKAKSDNEIIVTKNTTEGINIVANGIKWKRGDRIVTSVLEHHSNYIVWLRLKQRYGVEIEVVMPKKPMIQGLLDSSDFEKTIDDNTKLVAIAHVSNVLGSVAPVEEIAKIAHEYEALMLVDGAQSVPHMRIDVQKMGCDFLAFSGHKMCGPTGVGILYMNQSMMSEVEPLNIGGGAIEDVDIDSYTLNKSSKRFEAGTPPIAEVIGLGAAVDYLQELGLENIENYEKTLTTQMYEQFRGIPKVEIYGPEPKNKIGIQAFNVGVLNSHDVALALDVTANIMTRSGHHCALPLLKRVIKRDGIVRASTYFYNTTAEVNKLAETVRDTAQNLTK